MKVIILLFVASIIILYSCSEDVIIPEIVDELEFSCPNQNSNSYLEGNILNNFFCYKDSVNGYRLEISKTMAINTNLPSITINQDSQFSNLMVWGNLGFIPHIEYIHNINGEALPHLKHYIVIETPADSHDLSLEKFIENNISEIRSIPIRSDVVDDYNGFNIVFRFNDLEANTSRIFETSGGDQTNSHLSITNLKIDQLHSGLTSYSITLEFTCNLYYRGDPNKFFSRIDNGKMELHFIL